MVKLFVVFTIAELISAMERTPPTSECGDDGAAQICQVSVWERGAIGARI
jgi:hypothetical protein